MCAPLFVSCELNSLLKLLIIKFLILPIPLNYSSNNFFIFLFKYTYISKNIKQEGCLIYDENERTLESSVILESTQFIPLVHIEGIKFSAKSFQLEINIRQMMVLSMEDSIKKNCMMLNKYLNHRMVILML